MDRVRKVAGWHKELTSRCLTTPAELQALADACEGLKYQDQHDGFERVLPLLLGEGTVPGRSSGHDADAWAVGDDDSLHIALLADSGAFESAALALLPERATYTGGRLADGAFVAQVVLPSGAGAHSRQAKSLAMAWLAALLRAVARELVEQRAR